MFSFEKKPVAIPMDDTVGGFSFENCRRWDDDFCECGSNGSRSSHNLIQFLLTNDDCVTIVRNKNLAESKNIVPKFTKTGTTIVGCVFKDGVVLGADTRATGGSIVEDPNCSKIHYVAPNIYCCGAGVAADCDYVTRLLSNQIALHRLYTGKESRVISVATILKQKLYRYQGYIGSAIIIGGIDITGPSVRSVSPHGYSMKFPYLTLGSGSLAALSVLELGWKCDLERNDAIELVKNAILSGIQNDLGSGSNVDICVITKSNVEYTRGFYKSVESRTRMKSYKFTKGTTGKNNVK